MLSSRGIDDLKRIVQADVGDCASPRSSRTWTLAASSAGRPAYREQVQTRKLLSVALAAGARSCSVASATPFIFRSTRTSQRPCSGWESLSGTDPPRTMRSQCGTTAGSSTTADSTTRGLGPHIRTSRNSGRPRTRSTSTCPTTTSPTAATRARTERRRAVGTGVFGGARRIEAVGPLLLADEEPLGEALAPSPEPHPRPLRPDRGRGGIRLTTTPPTSSAAQGKNPAARANRADLDVSPAISDCLRFPGLNDDRTKLSWQFIEAGSVPSGR